MTSLSITFFATLDFTCAQDGESEAEFLPDDSEEKPEREKKHTNFTLCNVCNIQLNSTAQAQIHYNGKSHQKRLKQLSNGMLKIDNGKFFQKACLLNFPSSASMICVTADMKVREWIFIF